MRLLAALLLLLLLPPPLPTTLFLQILKLRLPRTRISSSTPSLPLSRPRPPSLTPSLPPLTTPKGLSCLPCSSPLSPSPPLSPNLTVLPTYQSRRPSPLPQAATSQPHCGQSRQPNEAASYQSGMSTHAPALTRARHTHHTKPGLLKPHSSARLHPPLHTYNPPTHTHTCIHIHLLTPALCRYMLLDPPCMCLMHVRKVCMQITPPRTPLSLSSALPLPVPDPFLSGLPHSPRGLALSSLLLTPLSLPSAISLPHGPTLSVASTFAFAASSTVTTALWPPVLTAI